jgi:hypothetical protein
MSKMQYDRHKSVIFTAKVAHFPANCRFREQETTIYRRFFRSVKALGNGMAFA